MPKYACKKDATHDEVAAEFERQGCMVLDSSRYPGFVDLVVLRHGIRLVEVKSKTGSLRDAQEKLIADGWPVEIVRSRIEAIAAVQRWDREQKPEHPHYDYSSAEQRHAVMKVLSFLGGLELCLSCPIFDRPSEKEVERFMAEYQETLKMALAWKNGTNCRGE